MKGIIRQSALMAGERRLRQVGAAAVLLLALCVALVGGEAVADESSVIPETLSAGGYHTCGIGTDGTVACWGANAGGQSTAPSGTFTQISAGVSTPAG